MQNAAHAAPDVDPKEVKRAQEGWHSFVRIMTKASVCIVIGVALLAWITL